MGKQKNTQKKEQANRQMDREAYRHSKDKIS